MKYNKLIKKTNDNENFTNTYKRYIQMHNL